MRKIFFEIENIFYVCPAPSINTLIIISHCTNIAMLGSKQSNQFVLSLICILKLIYQYLLESITVMIQTPEEGGTFEYVKNVRDAEQGDMNYVLSNKVIDGEIPPKTLSMGSGSLVLFRGRNSMHRVTPVKGNRTRMLVVLAYNTEPGISLSESARMTFYGRLG